MSGLNVMNSLIESPQDGQWCDATGQPTSSGGAHFWWGESGSAHVSAHEITEAVLMSGLEIDSIKLRGVDAPTQTLRVELYSEASDDFVLGTLATTRFRVGV